MVFVFLNMYVACTCRCVILCEDMHSSSFCNGSPDYNNTHYDSTIPFPYCIRCPLKTNSDSWRKGGSSWGRREKGVKEGGGMKVKFEREFRRVVVRKQTKLWTVKNLK